MCLALTHTAFADPPAGAPPPPAESSSASPDSSPRKSVFASFAQAFNQDYDHDVVRGHFDVGTAPDAHRYYCLVDAKTGKRRPNGVPGQPVARADGMTGIKATAVSIFSCDSAEHDGHLVTTGYALLGGAAASAQGPAPAVATAGANDPARPASAAPVTAATVTAGSSPAASSLAGSGPARNGPRNVDVAGITLGMPLDEVRSILKAKQLRDYFESAASLGGSLAAPSLPERSANARFVNIIAAWTPPGSGAVGSDGYAESFEVMFTPDPGRERVMGVVHSVTYPRSRALRESVLNQALIKKYGGFGGAADVPAAATWRVQSGGAVLVGDECNRRGILAGLKGTDERGDKLGGTVSRPNLALQTTADEFRFQVDRCGVAIVTEDHAPILNDAATHERMVSEFTVTAYSPAIGLEGALAALSNHPPSGAEQRINAAGNAVPAPSL